MFNRVLEIAIHYCCQPVTEYGGVLCHAAIVSREYGIPAIVSCHDVMNKIKDGDIYVRKGTESEKANNYEISKIIERELPEASKEVLLVLDAIYPIGKATAAPTKKGNNKLLSSKLFSIVFTK